MSTLVLRNGRIHTLDPNQPAATALAVHGRRILAVGADADVLDAAGPRATVLDLEGRAVLPGFWDCHIHFYDWALVRFRLDLGGCASLEDFLARLGGRAVHSPLGEWIMGHNWNENAWAEPRMPDRRDLDGVAPDHPVILWRADLHLAVANSLALRLAGIDADTPDPPKGAIARDEHGQPTGVLLDGGINLVKAILPDPSPDEVAHAMELGMAAMHRLGITAVHDIRLMGGLEHRSAFGAWQRLREAGRISLRAFAALPGERLEEAVALGLRTGLGDDYLRVGALKYFTDGSMGARTAWVLEPYLDGSGSGLCCMPFEEILQCLATADANGLAVTVHAIGDRSGNALATAFEELARARKPGQGPPIPHRVEHAQMLRPEDIARLARAGVAVSAQPIHLVDDMDMIDRSLGELGRHCYPFRSLVEAGVPLVFGSDAPVADPNPWLGVCAAVTRARPDGAPEGGWHPGQRLDVSQAVTAYTSSAAKTYGLDDRLGSLTPGKLADLVVLDRDPLAVDAAELAGTTVELTVFDGAVRHADGDFAGL